MKPSRKAVELLRQVEQKITDAPSAFDMGTWAAESASSPCGTVACIAGWLVLLHTPKREWKRKIQEWHFVDPSVQAARLLEISSLTSWKLFYVSHWPHDLRAQYEETLDVSVRARVAVQRIEHFIETGE